MADGDGAFTYAEGRVEPGETRNLRYAISETYLGDPVRLPVTIRNGAEPGPTVFLSAAIHGDELNGIEVVRTVAQDWPDANLHGTLVCLPVLNVPGFIAQQRYLPVYDRDLNRSFPGSETGTSADRMAVRLYEEFIEPCDYGLDFHTSTRGRTNMLHVRADMDDPDIARLARAFGSNVIIDGAGPTGSLRGAACDGGTPTITVEMGQAHRFERGFIDRALDGVASVLAEYDCHPAEPVRWPGWRTVVSRDQKTWLRADAGGLVEMLHDRGELVREGDVVCTITNPFKTETVRVTAPFDGLLVGVLENPVVYPGNPLCHLVELDEPTIRAYERAREGTLPERP
ncbi:succinylglutamate desuccinylase/aspartoacylase family protein [Halarchaeum nitratireducens]|uniref:Succinate dehydrogenase n=1 Tax=Halarchaeum nitratireducens TaxID=489913 RepID=A0A830GA67_9EURY|nr:MULTISPECIES: succinylglutamate desuccinylase/aspartoacylase family protein [Halarchaeum]MBP2250593.1 putative deacylase [Halarchaeum solikamskense]GGN15503.1 succinate dehydrogenase [Halarchaeum nitratireducens]